MTSDRRARHFKILRGDGETASLHDAGEKNLCAMFHSGRSDPIYQRLRQLVRFRSCRKTCHGTSRSISSLRVCSGLNDRGPGASLRYSGADVTVMISSSALELPTAEPSRPKRVTEETLARLLGAAGRCLACK